MADETKQNVAPTLDTKTWFTIAITVLNTVMLILSAFRGTPAPAPIPVPAEQTVYHVNVPATQFDHWAREKKN